MTEQKKEHCSGTLAELLAEVKVGELNINLCYLSVKISAWAFSLI